MTDYATYRALPAQERDELGFARWKELQRIGTHGPGCHAWGPRHYDCAVRENAALAAEVERLRTNAARYEWLRGQFWHKSNLFVVQGDKSNVMLGTRCPSKSSLDAAIDAAMADKGAPT